MSKLAVAREELFNQRREWVFLLVAGLFLGTVGMMNILSLTRFVDLSFNFGPWTVPMFIPLGVLPYPITFLCTDIISEFWGKKRANRVVWVGFLVNIWIIFILWLGGALPPEVPLDPLTHLPPLAHPDRTFYQLRLFTLGSILGSMLAYLAAQFLDVYLFHFWKDLTQGKHLWLRNNGSTLVSQLVDSTIVITVAHTISGGLPLITGENEVAQIIKLILASYTFKALATLFDTPFCYLAVYGLRRYFGLSHKTSHSLQTLPLRLITD